MEASCKKGRKFNCEYAKHPAVPCGATKLRAYSYVTQVAGNASSALHHAPRSSSARKSNTAAANTNAAIEYTPAHTANGACSTIAASSSPLSTLRCRSGE